MLIKDLKLNKDALETTLSAIVVQNSGKTTEVFFTVDNKYYKFIKSDGSPFLACLLLPAMKLNENIHIDSNISPKTLSNLKKIMAIVSKWDIGLNKIQVTSTSTIKDQVNLDNIGSFFSGGVDSFATYLENKSSSKEKISHFIFVYGFDIFLKNDLAFNRVIKVIQAIAKQEKIKLIIVKTNLRDITDPMLAWNFAFGGALSGISFFLRNGFKAVYLPGYGKKDQAYPCGSHPDIDYLWSTEKFRIIHNFGNINRLQKVKKYISKSPLALKHLRVCWLNYKYNCGSCSKCIRTMLELQLAGSLHKSDSFPKKIDIQRIKKLNLASDAEQVCYTEILLQLRKERKSPEIQEAIEYAFIRSKNPDINKKFRAIVGLFDRKFNNERLFWYLAKRGMTRL